MEGRAIKVASFNVENMFRRPAAFKAKDEAEGDRIVSAYAEFQQLIDAPVCSDAAKGRIIELLNPLGLKKSDDSEWAVLRQNRGHLLARHKDGTVEVTATGRGSWVGWVDLVTDAVNEVSTQNTAAVIQDINPD